MTLTSMFNTHTQSFYVIGLFMSLNGVCLNNNWIIINRLLVFKPSRRTKSLFLHARSNDISNWRNLFFIFLLFLLCLHLFIAVTLSNRFPINASQCPAFQWQCDNGDCIDVSETCDGTRNCRLVLNLKYAIEVKLWTNKLWFWSHE